MDVTSIGLKNRLGACLEHAETECVRIEKSGCAKSILISSTRYTELIQKEAALSPKRFLADISPSLLSLSHSKDNAEQVVIKVSDMGKGYSDSQIRANFRSQAMAANATAKHCETDTEQRHE